MLYIQSLDLHKEMGAKLDSAEDIERLAHVAATMEKLDRAARLFGAAAALRETLGAPHSPVDRARYGSVIDNVRVHLDEASFESIWAEGRTMTLDQATDYALVEEGDDS